MSSTAAEAQPPAQPSEAVPAAAALAPAAAAAPAASAEDEPPPPEPFGERPGPPESAGAQCSVWGVLLVLMSPAYFKDGSAFMIPPKRMACSCTWHGWHRCQNHLHKLQLLSLRNCPVPQSTLREGTEAGDAREGRLCEGAENAAAGLEVSA